VAGNLKDAATVEKHPSMEGRFMNMILVPVAPKTPPKPKAERPARPANNVAASSTEGTTDTAMAAAFKSTEATPTDA